MSVRVRFPSGARKGSVQSDRPFFVFRLMTGFILLSFPLQVLLLQMLPLL